MRDVTLAIVSCTFCPFLPGRGDAYSLFFEQPSLRFGTREIVMYNRLDEHVMPSHDTFLLIRTPDQLRTGAGWYAVHDAPQPHWKYFWFD